MPAESLKVCETLVDGQVDYLGMHGSKTACMSRGRLLQRLSGHGHFSSLLSMLSPIFLPSSTLSTTASTAPRGIQPQIQLQWPIVSSTNACT